MDVRTICLGVLSIDDATGYEVKKAIEEGPFRQCAEASYGAIYPALARLTEDGAVECRVEAQYGKPDKKVYSITAKGREQFLDELLKEPDMDKVKSDFMFILLFSENLPPEHMQRLIDKRLEHLKLFENMNKPVGERRSVGARFAIGYWQALLRTSIDYLERNRHVFDQPPQETAQLTRQPAE